MNLRCGGQFDRTRPKQEPQVEVGMSGLDTRRRHIVDVDVEETFMENGEITDTRFLFDLSSCRVDDVLTGGVDVSAGLHPSVEPPMVNQQQL